MKRKLHAISGFLAFSTIAVFWLSTAISEVFLSYEAVSFVKNAVAYALIGYVPLIAIVGATGFKLGGKSKHQRIVAKRRRMPFIAINGICVLVPSALFLATKANAGEFDEWFYFVQGIELLAGALNLTLMGLNIRDGLKFTEKRRSLRSREEKAQ